MFVILGTENAADDDDRRNIAVEKETGGSYVVSNFSANSLERAFHVGTSLQFHD